MNGLLQQQFAIGVNEVTRVLERMPPAGAADKAGSPQQRNVVTASRKVPLVQLQVKLTWPFCQVCIWFRKIVSLHFDDVGAETVCVGYTCCF